MGESQCDKDQIVQQHIEDRDVEYVTTSVAGEQQHHATVVSVENHQNELIECKSFNYLL